MRRYVQSKWVQLTEVTLSFIFAFRFHVLLSTTFTPFFVIKEKNTGFTSCLVSGAFKTGTSREL